MGNADNANMGFTEIFTPKNEDDKSGPYNRWLKFLNCNYATHFDIEETMEQRIERITNEAQQNKEDLSAEIRRLGQLNMRLSEENNTLKWKIRRLEGNDEIASSNGAPSPPVLINPTSPTEYPNGGKVGNNQIKWLGDKIAI